MQYCFKLKYDLNEARIFNLICHATTSQNFHTFFLIKIFQTYPGCFAVKRGFSNRDLTVRLALSFAPAHWSIGKINSHMSCRLPMLNPLSFLPDFNPENAKDCNQETLFGQHLLVCALQEVGCLMLGLGTTAGTLLSDQSLSECRHRLFQIARMTLTVFFSFLSYRSDRHRFCCPCPSVPGSPLGCGLVLEVYVCCRTEPNNSPHRQVRMQC